MWSTVFAFCTRLASNLTIAKKKSNCVFGFLWQDLAASMDEEDVGKFTDAIKEFDSMTRLVMLQVLEPFLYVYQSDYTWLLRYALPSLNFFYNENLKSVDIKGIRNHSNR